MSAGLSPGAGPKWRHTPVNARPYAVVTMVLALAILAGPVAAAHGAGDERIAQAAPPATAAPPAAPEAPAPSPLAQDAVTALKGLDATLARRGGVQEYLDGFKEAKVRVDKYLGSEVAGDGALRDAVRGALRYHEIVASAVTRPTTAAEQAAIGRDPALEQCPKLKEFLAGFGKAAATPTTEEEAKNRGIAVVGFGLGAVLACAADRTAEAQRLLDAKP